MVMDFGQHDDGTIFIKKATRRIIFKPEITICKYNTIYILQTVSMKKLKVSKGLCIEC